MSKDNKHKRTDKKPNRQEEVLQDEQGTVEADREQAVEPAAAQQEQAVESVADETAEPADKSAGAPEKPADIETGTARTDGNEREKPQKAAAAQRPATAGGGKGLSVLALLVALASAGATGWMWSQGQQAVAPAPVVEQADHSAELQEQAQKLQQLAQQGADYHKLVEALEQQVSQLAGQADSLPKAAQLAENQRLLVQLQSAQQAFTKRFEQAFGSTRQDWRLAEAEHLMRMAHLRLAALQDLNSARYLLEAADQILYEQDDPAAFAAREALAQALAEVRAVPKLDRAGVFMRLGALQKQVGKLDQTLPGYSGGASDTGSIDWNKLLDKASSYIRLDVNSTADDIRPLLSSQQLTHIRLAVSLSLEQAQWAALNGQQAVYDQAVAQGIEFLERYFSGDHQAAGSMRTQLQELAGSKVSQSMPDINPALVALQGYIQERTLERRAPKEEQQ